MSYESRRITISYLAVEELQKLFNIPTDAPTQALSAAVEKLIFQGGVGVIQQPQSLPKTQPTAPMQPNKTGLASMAAQFKGAA